MKTLKAIWSQWAWLFKGVLFVFSTNGVAYSYKVIIGVRKSHEPLGVDGVVEEPVGRRGHRYAALEHVFWRNYVINICLAKILKCSWGERSVSKGLKDGHVTTKILVSKSVYYKFHNVSS